MFKKYELSKKFIILTICLMSIQVLNTVFVFHCFAQENEPVMDFISLQVAINSGTGAAIEIANDINLNAAITIGKDLTFKAAQGAGEVKLTATGSRHFNVSGGDVALTFDGNVVLDGGSSAGGINSTAANLTLNNAVIQNCATTMNGGGVFASHGVTINGCTFSDNSGGTGGGGAVWSSADLTVHNAAFINNKSLTGGGIYAVGDAAIFNSTFTGNIARGAEAGGTGSSGGGGICANGNIAVYSCTISDNSAGNGGGICSYVATGNKTITVGDGTKITGNKSLSPAGSCGGGAIYSASSRVIIESGEIIGNTSVTSGGAIYSDGGLTVTGGMISQNIAGTGGGAARVYGAVMNVSGGEISGNTAGRYGGAIMTGADSATVSGAARIVGNVSNGTGVYDGGGGLSLYYCTLTVSGGEISGNTASHANGGGIGDYWGSAINVMSGAITDNHAPEGDGGGIYITDLTKVTSASGTMFSGNTASRTFWMTDPGDIALHNANIHTDSRSAPLSGNRAFTYLFNNYDVNYTKGNTQNLLPLYSITVTDDGNGTAGSETSVTYPGETVTLTAAPHSGYKFKEWIVLSGNVAVINNEGAFIMPDSDVVIEAVFEPVPVAGEISNNNRITGNRVYNYSYDHYTVTEETPPPLAGLSPPNSSNPNTGGQPAAVGVFLGISMMILGIFMKKKV